MAGSNFTIEDAPSASPSGFTVEDAQKSSGTVSETPQTRQNPFTMLGEGQETEAAGNAEMAPTALPIAANIAGDLASPVVGGLAYAGTKAAMQPEEVKAHPLRTAAETAGAMVLPSVIGKASEYLKPAFSRLASGAGDMWDYLRSPAFKFGEEAESAAPAIANAAPTPPAPASAPVAGPPPASPLSNRQIGSRIEQGVKEAAGTTPGQPGQPIYTRPVQGTVGAKTVAEMPNTEVAGPPIATPSRNQTLTNYAGENVEKAAARTPMTPRNQGQFYEDFSPRERQDIHTNMEVRTPNGYEPIPNAENHWERLSKTPEVREDLFKMENDQVREALRKSGLTDMQNKTVKSSDWTFQGKGGKPFRDPNVIPRAKALGMMMDNGVSDEDIIKWGGGEETRSKVYRARTTAGPSREGLAAGPADRGYPEQK